MSDYVLGIDLGGTKLAARLCLSNGTIVDESVRFAETDFVCQLSAMYEEYTGQWGPIRSIVLGVPGPVSDNIMGPSLPLKTVKPTRFEGCFPNADLLGVYNDLDVATYAELHCGAGLEVDNFVLVSLSTGIGVGVVIGGSLLQIRTEMGHQVLMLSKESRNRCINHSGCWASICAGTAIPDNPTLEDLAVIKEVNRLGFANLIAAYDPEIIIVMGGVGFNLFDTIVPASHELEGLAIHRPLPRIELTALGPNIGVQGAVLLAQGALG